MEGRVQLVIKLVEETIFQLKSILNANSYFELGDDPAVVNTFLHQLQDVAGQLREEIGPEYTLERKSLKETNLFFKVLGDLSATIEFLREISRIGSGDQRYTRETERLLDQCLVSLEALVSCQGFERFPLPVTPSGSIIERSAMRLTGEQCEQLTNAFLHAFPSMASLAQMVRFKLDRNLETIAIGNSLKEITFKLIETAQAEGWIAQLVAAARESNPGNPSLLIFAQQFGLAPFTRSRLELERIIRATNSFLDINIWLERLGGIEAQVCCIEIATDQEPIFGTGFLLGPSVVITNYHVIEAVVVGDQGLTMSDGVSARPSDVILRFDYKRLADGTVINQGMEYRLATQDWLIDASPYPIRSGLPQPDELDFALLRVEGAPGYESIREHAELQASQRGWIDVPAEPYDFQPGSPLFIVQHPRGEPLKLAIDTDAIIGLNKNGTVVTYKTNTEWGSSGSPCFNSNWDLVAIHHSGDPAFGSPTYNAGTPFGVIVALLEDRGLKGVLGE